jgi:cell division septation protein DedD
MTKRTAFFVMMMLFAAACGPDPDEIVKTENKKLTELEPVEAAKVEEAMSRIRFESEIIAKGGVLPSAPDTLATDSSTVTESAPAPAPAPRPAAPVRTAPVRTQSATTTSPETGNEFPHHIQVGAFTNEDGAKSAAAMWEKRGFANVISMENPNATTVYKYVVRLTGYTGYAKALAESNRINETYRLRSYPIQVTE